ncbi:transcriptional regulator, propionate catabolism operon regulatory protein [Acinetobacter marinus]|uniref:Transcriptional regulator, propionate catabolism operon regulatory protein n=1 Tax=Acinetobacter marinus TaxID=281375 RepID=A0A1G6GI30_9GAMM|nr:sigma 54-interacting transcriptional regulator [Acinetobacter marinus]SDB81657.1 transcriptional regulator, propionate catabolism operon regulatory protein [Acinetobacter marinus]
MLERKPINILVTYLKQPNINGFRSLLWQAIAAVETDQIDVVECHIADVESVAKDLVAQGCQILLCTGATASYLQNKINIDVQTLGAGAFDVIQAISNLKQYQRIALMGNASTVNLADFTDIFALDIQHFHYDSYLSAKQTVQRIKNLGFDAIIGSPVVVELAINEGMVGYLAMSVPSLKLLLKNALRTLEKLKREQNTTLRLTEIYNHLHEGIGFITKQKKISFINHAMSQLLERDLAEIIGQSAQVLFQGIHFEVDEDNAHQLIQFEQKKLAVYISKLKNDHLNGYILRVQELNALEHSSSQFRKVKTQHFSTRYRFDQLQSHDENFQKTIALAKAYGKTDSTILITGESGTGKEVLAQSIHQISQRSKAPFVAINCASFPESLLESELFGYAEGAFTGAKKNGRIGLIETAHNGTLFLDEIGDMPLHLQTRFLRVLQERQIHRLGSVVSHMVNIRVIAATHADLESLVKQGQFRADLYYRLNILRIFVPALRQRQHDILYLSSLFLMRFQRTLDDLPKQLQQALLKYRWPVNIRELENMIERIHVLLQLDQQWLQSDFLQQQLPELFIEAHDQPIEHSTPLKTLKTTQELALIQQMLEEVDGDLDLAAQRLGISRTTLWRRMKLLKNRV